MAVVRATASMHQGACLVWRGCDLDLQIGAIAAVAGGLLQQVAAWGWPMRGVVYNLNLGGVCMDRKRQHRSCAHAVGL